MYAKSLKISDFKCFGDATLDFQFPGRTGKGVSEIDNVNLILGDNGGGKSSVLRAIAIALLAPALKDSGFVAHRLVRRPRENQKSVRVSTLAMEAIADRTELRIGRSAKDKSITLSASIRRRGDGSIDRLQTAHADKNLVVKMLYSDDTPAFFVVGYGATRRVETSEYSESSARRSRGFRYQRVAGLFEDHVALRPLDLWLPRLIRRRPELRSQIIKLINAVLPDSLRFSGKRDLNENQYFFEFEGAITPFASLSDGYKAYVGWTTDLIGYLADVVPSQMKIDQVPGVVLVDEIDLHLHPEWQRTVVPSLAKTFPKIQFVFTSHSPIVLSVVRRENVFVTDAAADGTATVKQLEERVYARSSDELLLSSYFGLRTTRPEEFENQAGNLFARAANGDANAALDYLAQLSTDTSKRTAGASKRTAKKSKKARARP